MTMGSILPRFGCSRLSEDRLATSRPSPSRMRSLVADGKSIIYGTDHDVYSVNRDGSSSRKLLTANGIPFGFRFSPDGRTFRFTEFDSTSRFHDNH